MAQATDNTGLASIDRPWMTQYADRDESFLNRFQEKTIWEVMEGFLEEYRDVPLIEYMGKTISRQSFHEHVVRCAKALKAFGVQEGEVIPLLIPAIPEAFMLFFAINAIGAIPYYVKIDIASQALENETKQSKVAVVYDGLWPNAKDVFEGRRFQHVIVISASDSMGFPMKQLVRIKSRMDLRNNSIAIPKTEKYITPADCVKIAGLYKGDYKVPYKPDRVACITSSSGTTSHDVKGIMDTNEGILKAMACSLASEPGLSKGSRMFTCFPLMASTSLNCEHLLPAFTGGTIVMDPRADISLWFDLLMKTKPDAAVSTGSVWERFALDVLQKEKESNQKIDLSWADYFIMGGSGTTPEILDWINSVLLQRGMRREIKVGYGLSEGFGVLTVNKYNKESDEKQSGSSDRAVISVGKPLKGYTIGAFDENGKELPYGKGLRGELWFKTPANMHGYYNKSELTDQTIVDGWIHSGDLCEIDEEGNVYIYGRIKNSIRISGRTDYLFDYSNELRMHFDLHDVLVEKKSLSNGEEALNVYYVQKENCRIDSRVMMQKMDAFFDERNVVINGYKEHYVSLPIDPATIKPRTKDTDGFKRLIDGTEYDVSYSSVALDLYEETRRESGDAEAKQAREFTGYPSVDKPWLNYYKPDAEKLALNTPKDINFYRFYMEHVFTKPSFPILKYFNAVFTTEEFISMIELWARAFRAVGVTEDEMVPIYGTWCPEIAAMFFSLNAIGAHPYYEKLDITKSALLSETIGAKVAVVFEPLWNDVACAVFSEERFETVFMIGLSDSMRAPIKQMMWLKNREFRKSVPQTNKFVFSEQARELASQFKGKFEVPFRKDRIAVITSSSGTTSSLVKGIMDTNESALANVLASAYSEPRFFSGKECFITLPPTASTAINCFFLLPLYMGMTVRIDPRADEQNWTRLLLKYKPSLSFSTGSLWHSFFRNVDAMRKSGKTVNLSFLETFFMGGSGVTPAQLDFINTVAKECNAPRSMVTGYGCSEFFGVITAGRYDVDYIGHSKSVINVGVPISCATVGIFDGEGNELTYGQRGEIRVKGTSLMHGYFGKPGVSAAMFDGEWLITGDVGEMDENGYVYCYGRMSSSIEMGGKTVYLFDIANDLRETFMLEDCMAEVKKLAGGKQSVVVYYVQRPEKRLEEKEICEKINAFMEKQGIVIEGYREFEGAFPISPTTLKPQTRYTDGFIQFTPSGDKLVVSYKSTETTDVWNVVKEPE